MDMPRHFDAIFTSSLTSTSQMIDNSELKQVTFLTTRTSTGSKVDVFHQSQPLTQSSDVTHAVRVVKNVTCLNSLLPDDSLSKNCVHDFLAAILAVSVIHAMKREQSRILAVSAILAVSVARVIWRDSLAKIADTKIIGIDTQ